jgi:hypothetical protein
MGGEVDWGRRTTGTRVASADRCHPTQGGRCYKTGTRGEECWGTQRDLPPEMGPAGRR